ncbi:hypothetical protein BDV41DRAFT_133422 [Aspergillus transmontanensis]|uniref:Uncharacterized protein n=1 Tax=Aspergillus transmontanensis TaxID=1034304 RepID=A0A5N6VDI8_9EURO|nr:hypothetical protein BDV41DRAFT_133422 [Aspergillus transmontanensis]
MAKMAARRREVQYTRCRSNRFTSRRVKSDMQEYSCGDLYKLNGMGFRTWWEAARCRCCLLLSVVVLFQLKPVVSSTNAS